MTNENIKKQSKSIYDKKIINRALIDAFIKLNPKTLFKNPVMFVVLIGSIITTIMFFENIVKGYKFENLLFQFQITIWLWFTVLFANFAEAMAEGRGKAQADTLKKNKQDGCRSRIICSRK